MKYFDHIVSNFILLVFFVYQYILNKIITMIRIEQYIYNYKINNMSNQIPQICLAELQSCFDKKGIISESVESLESLLPRLHRKANDEQLEKEHRIIIYLRQQHIQFKTDPRQKEYEYFEMQKAKAPILKVIIGDQEDYNEEQIKTIPQIKSEIEFNPWINPLLVKRHFHM
ncbi:hypothetical protein pb186bvf_008865 [Paramecium bursaria]